MENKKQAPELLLNELLRTMRNRASAMKTVQSELNERLTALFNDMEVTLKKAERISGSHQVHSPEDFSNQVKNLVINADEFKVQADSVSRTSEKLKGDLNSQITIFMNQLNLIQNMSKNTNID